MEACGVGYMYIADYNIQTSNSLVSLISLLFVFVRPPQGDAQKVYGIASQTDDIRFTPDFTASMKSLWADSGVQKCVQRAREYQLNDSAE